jgi:PhnB protein
MRARSRVSEMDKGSLYEQLDQALVSILAGRDSSLAEVNPEIAPLLRVARDLRDLPREDFRIRLKAELQRRASMATPAVKPVREGFHSITPYMIVPGASDLIQFMKDAFGATERFRVQRPGSEQIMHAEVKIDDCIIELADATSEFPAMPAAIHLYVSDVDAVHARAVRAGGVEKYPPTDQVYGERSSFVQDSFGNHWYIATLFSDTPRPAGLLTVTPYLLPRGAARLLDFLKEAFGAEEVERATAPDGTVVHAGMRIGDSIIEMGEPHGEYQPMPFTLHLYVNDTDTVYASALRAGATSLREPRDEPYGDRNSGVQDPFGNRWFIATHIRDVQF